MVIGSKFHPDSKVDYPLLRRVYSFLYYMLVRALFGSVRDTQTGIKLFKRRGFGTRVSAHLVKRFAFDLEVFANAHHFGYRIVEAPVTLNFKRVCSRLRFAAVWNVFLDTLAIFYRMRILQYYDRSERVAIEPRPRCRFARNRRPRHYRRLAGVGSKTALVLLLPGLGDALAASPILRG